MINDRGRISYEVSMILLEETSEGNVKVDYYKKESNYFHRPLTTVYENFSFRELREKTRSKLYDMSYSITWIEIPEYNGNTLQRRFLKDNTPD
ncbi:hypothetical protein N780_10265 [Pontibacillus chungwhensis BH030062]|uniref:Uncharacterized protein n=1 Tax=Pontibacillus chungwhensis BH030062 TaxID=1385513 RepID=A0A0A2USC0_9BACI|nr:hypothetical protein [Pontibacillus chungwhensis]KGP89668.1 hypothetical protein N780_10265 [Pontibacillus chungwhensis BH030062]